jgi:hypothetical protein
VINLTKCSSRERTKTFSFYLRASGASRKESRYWNFRKFLSEKLLKIYKNTKIELLLWHFRNLISYENSSVRYVAQFTYVSLDSRDSIDFNVSHRVCLSADEVLLVEDRRVGVGVSVDGAHRFEARLED